MVRRIILYAGAALVALGVAAIGIALTTGIWDYTTALGCSSAAQTPSPPIGIEGVSLVVYDQCNYTVVSPYLSYGGLIALVGAVTLIGVRVVRANPTR